MTNDVSDARYSQQLRLSPENRPNSLEIRPKSAQIRIWDLIWRMAPAEIPDVLLGKLTIWNPQDYESVYRYMIAHLRIDSENGQIVAKSVIFDEIWGNPLIRSPYATETPRETLRIRSWVFLV